MTDIIKSAQQLLDGATPAPWEWSGYSLESEHGMVLDFQCVTAFGQSGALREVEVTPEDEVLIAAAPELAQALAEETYEYGVEYKYLTNRGAEWRLDPSAGWHKTYRAAERAASTSVRFRIVRRRVSPPEVINE